MKKSKKQSKLILETPPPPPCRILSMEIESYHRKILEMESIASRANPYSDDLAVYKAEILMRLDLYRLSSGIAYERLSDVARGDKLALIKLFSELNGNSWKEKFGWIGQSKTQVRPEIPMFEAEAGLFDGIHVSERRVAGINLTNNNCEGQLSDRIGDYAALNSLYLDYNNIDGKIPRGLGRLELLEYFSISCNRLVGELEERCLTKLTTLRILDISFNQMSGTLPNCFDSITKLQELNLSGNQFTGALPSTLSTCVNIRHLKLYSNRFSGPVPDWLGGYSNLLTINLSNNNFSGGINCLFTCLKLKKIQLTSNNLTLPLSSSISSLSTLSLLYLHHNAITGRIPSTLTALTSLKYLNLSYNDFTGVLPDDFGNLTHLKICILSHTHLTGPLPSSISKLNKLNDFHIFASSNSETMSLDRGFLPSTFQRVYVWSIEKGLDNIHWNESERDTMKDIGNVFDTGKKKKKKKHNERRMNRFDDEENTEQVLARLRKIHQGEADDDEEDG